jgi:hypothetical protein
VLNGMAADLCNKHDIKYCKHIAYFSCLGTVILTSLSRSSNTAVRQTPAFSSSSRHLPRSAFGQRYEDGKELEKYSGDRSYDTLASFIDTQSKRYIRSLGARGADSSGHSAEPSPAGVNMDGIAEEVDQAKLQQMKEDGPVFVKFYAPW